MNKSRLAIFVAFAALGAASQASAVTVTLNEVARFNVGAPFGLAYDGSNLWFTQGSEAREISTSGVLTGRTSPLTYGFSALGWDSVRGQLASASGSTVSFRDRVTGANEEILNLDTTGLNGFSLIDGLDIDHGQAWFSPDVGYVGTFSSTTGAQAPGQPFLPSTGGYSGVERVDVGSDTFVIVVNDEASPRELCVHSLDATEIGCTTLTNSRFEDLAFDGRYLYAADYFGTDIVKIDLLVDGGSIFDPGPVPEPAAFALFGLGAVGLGLARRKQG